MHPHIRPNAPLRLIAQLLDLVLERVRRLWRAHTTLLRTNTGYPAVLAAVAAALATQTTVADMLAAALAGVIAVYNTLRHDLNRN